jgi:predicted amidohydrolase
LSAAVDAPSRHRLEAGAIVKRKGKPMRDIRIAAAQFEAHDADKDYNFSRIADLTREAARQGAEIVSFHECCITGYAFLQTLSAWTTTRSSPATPW